MHRRTILRNNYTINVHGKISKLFIDSYEQIRYVFEYINTCVVSFPNFHLFTQTITFQFLYFYFDEYSIYFLPNLFKLQNYVHLI